MQADAQQAVEQYELLRISLEGWLTLGAVLLSPIIAIQVQKYLDRRSEQQKRKLLLFRELMATRASKLSPRHVDALNAIQVEFYAKKGQDRVVYELWKEYLDHLGKKVDEPNLGAWGNQADDILGNLLYEMSRALGYDYDKVAIKRDHYSPTGHATIEGELSLIRRGLVEVFAKNKALNIYAALFPNHPPIKVDVVEPGTNVVNVTPIPKQDVPRP